MRPTTLGAQRLAFGCARTNADADGVVTVRWRSGISLVMERSEAELLARSARDPEAFGVFYDRYAERLLTYFARRTWDAQDAADLTAETFAAAFAARRRYRDTGAPAFAWLVGIARHQLQRALRRQRIDGRARRRLRIERAALDDASLARIEELADLRAMRPSLSAALEQLPPATARAVELRVSEELPFAEVARRLGCSEGAARVRVTRGLRHLADLLEAA
jgi:RNA polymerase sigma-70 factor, ECF subfamily